MQSALIVSLLTVIKVVKQPRIYTNYKHESKEREGQKNVQTKSFRIEKQITWLTNLLLVHVNDIYIQHPICQAKGNNCIIVFEQQPDNPVLSAQNIDQISYFIEKKKIMRLYEKFFSISYSSFVIFFLKIKSLKQSRVYTRKCDLNCIGLTAFMLKIVELINYFFFFSGFPTISHIYASFV